MAACLYCRPTDILSYAATWSLTVGTADSSYPLTNLASVYAHVVSKTTGTTATYRGTISSTAIQAVALINCNLAGLTLVVTNNNAMASTNLVVPSHAADSVSLNAWVDLRTVTTAATQWNVAITGAAANIAIGKILLISTVREMPLRWGARVGERKPPIVHRTDYDVALGYRRGVRYRTFEPSIARESERTAYTALRRGSEGPTQPFLFVLEETVNDAAYVWFPEDTWTHERVAPAVTTWSDRLEEANPGVTL